MTPISCRWGLILLASLALIAVVPASTGDRNPTFQHCLRGCRATYCDPSQPPLPFYLRAFGWTCEADCKYQCTHAFTDKINFGSRWLQFYGKWPFYRLGPIQEPFSVLMSIGNLWVNIRGISELRRRVRSGNRLKKWLEIAGWAQVNTWIWSAVFHSRDTPFTERMDYFSATTTIALSLLYAIIRTLHLQTPLTTSRLLYPVTAIVAFLVVSHFTYLLSFPLGSFPYDCHTKYVLCFAIVHNILWLIWSLSFKVRYPRIQFGSLELSYPKPYPPKDPLRHLSPNAGKPFYLVIGTTLAMSFELLDFAPFWRIVDAHSMWHMFTIPLAAGWWLFFVNDAIEMEGSMLSARGINTVGLDGDEKMPLSGEGTLPQSSLGEVRTPRNTTSPAFAQLAAMVPPPKGKARSPSPRIPGKSERED